MDIQKDNRESINIFKRYHVSTEMFLDIISNLKQSGRGYSISNNFFSGLILKALHNNLSHVVYNNVDDDFSEIMYSILCYKYHPIIAKIIAYCFVKTIPIERFDNIHNIMSILRTIDPVYPVMYVYYILLN